MRAFWNHVLRGAAGLALAVAARGEGVSMRLAEELFEEGDWAALGVECRRAEAEEGAGARGDVLAEVAGFFGVRRRWLGAEDFFGVHACGVPEEAPERLVLSGMVFHSALGIEAVKTRVEGDVLRVDVRAGLARKGVDGNLNESIALPAGIREVQFGRGCTVVWSRRVADTWRKLGEIVVPKVEFVNTAPGDVLEFVCGKVAYATGEEEPEFEVVWEDAGDTLPPVTLTLERASVRDVLRAVDEALGVHTELKADGSGWVVRRVVRPEDCVVVPPSGAGVVVVEDGMEATPEIGCGDNQTRQSK